MLSNSQIYRKHTVTTFCISAINLVKEYLQSMKKLLKCCTTLKVYLSGISSPTVVYTTQPSYINNTGLLTLQVVVQEQPHTVVIHHATTGQSYKKLSSVCVALSALCFWPSLIRMCNSCSDLLN